MQTRGTVNGTGEQGGLKPQEASNARAKVLVGTIHKGIVAY